jgi:hypothetical protein
MSDFVLVFTPTADFSVVQLNHNNSMIAAVLLERVFTHPNLLLGVEDQMVPNHMHLRRRGFTAPKELKKVLFPDMNLPIRRLDINNILGEQVSRTLRVAGVPRISDRLHDASKGWNIGPVPTWTRRRKGCQECCEHQYCTSVE